MLAVNDLTTMYKGALIPQVIYQDIMSLNKTTYRKPSFWVREKNQSSAEVDLLITAGNKLIPVEIKSGKTGKLRSLHQFIDKCGHPYAIRMFAGEFSVEKTKTPAGTPYLLMNLPYYLSTKLNEYAEFFMKNHSL